MPDIGKYTQLVQVFLAEAGKYFVLLLFAVLAIRLWRRWSASPMARRSSNLALALTTTALTVVIGYFSMCQSLGKLNLHYGMEAFHAGRLPQAMTLFEASGKFWPGADAAGAKGVCLLLMGAPEPGQDLIEKARAMRHGHGTAFEDFYDGLYYSLQGQTTKAIPLLEVAGADPLYQWSVIKIFAVMELDAGRMAEAADQMKQFMTAEVTEYDQAYIIASLNLAGGKTNEAVAVLEKFPADTLTPAWQTRYEKLQAQLRK
jgi:hypothetical protein